MTSPYPAGPAMIGYSGLSPSFPSYEGLLQKTSFKVVVASWRRLNPTITSTGEFSVDVTSYAPKMPLITRMQLVDVDVPQVQQLIEASWGRFYFEQGVLLSTSMRSIEVSTPGGAVYSVILPLRFDNVTDYFAVAGGVIRISLEHRAPTPFNVLAYAWKQFPDHVGIRIFGVPAYPDGFLLTPENLAEPEGGSTLSFDVVSLDFYNAVMALPAGARLVMTAPPVPGPAFLGTVLTRAINTLLPWQFYISYNLVEDRFTLYATVPEHCSDAVISGPLLTYMGFPNNLFLIHGVRQYPGAECRSHPRDAYARLPSCSPLTGDELAALTQTAFNAYNWKPFSFGITYPGALTTTYNVPGGRMTLSSLAESITSLLAGIKVTSTSSEDGSRSGLHFESTTGNVFSVNWTVDPDFSPARVGYDRIAYPYSTQLFPTRQAEHVPLMDNTCSPPLCDTVITFNSDTQQLCFDSVPFSAFSNCTLSATATPFTYVVTSTTGFRHGLQVGARVVLVDGAGVQAQGIVYDVINAVQLLVICTGGAALNPAAVTVVPQDRVPLVLYMQIGCRPKATNANIFGFDHSTYGTGSLQVYSSGAIDLRKDPYILLCVTFQSTADGVPAGEVYYPFENGTNASVFAKILRSTCAFNAAYDRNFGYDFTGNGIHLGFISIRILNSDGSPYETHGQPVSVCFRFDARQSGVEIGGGGSLVCLDSIRKSRRG